MANGIPDSTIRHTQECQEIKTDICKPRFVCDWEKHWDGRPPWGTSFLLLLLNLPLLLWWAGAVHHPQVFKVFPYSYPTPIRAGGLGLKRKVWLDMGLYCFATSDVEDMVTCISESGGLSRAWEPIFLACFQVVPMQLVHSHTLRSLSLSNLC